MFFVDWLSPGLHNADEFLEVLASERKCYIGGPLRSGKTLLAFVIADYWIRNNMARGVWANIPHSMPKAEALRDAVVIIDEGGQFATAHTDYSLVHDMYGRWAGKLNDLFLFPSVDKVQANLRNLSVIRVFDVDLLPVRLLFYRWAYTLGSSGWFVLTEPEHYFGIYDTLYKPINDGGTLEAIVAESPEAVVEMLEARRGLSQLERVLEKHGYTVSGGKGSRGSRSSGPSEGERALVARVQSMESRLAELESAMAAAGAARVNIGGLSIAVAGKTSGVAHSGNGSGDKSAGYE